MKLFTFFFFIVTLQISAKSYSQNINLKGLNISLEQAFRQIENQTGCSFFINHKLLKGAKPVSITLQNATIEEAMQALLKGQDLAYEIIDKTVILKNRPQKQLSAEILTIDRRITGTVKDSKTGEPLAGVSIRVEGTTQGTVTDAQGKFALAIPEDAVLEINYLGYASQIITPGGKSSLEILLTATSTGLDEMVVVGYGREKKVNLTGAVDQIGSEVFKDRPTANATRSLQGALPGMFITFATGMPNQNYDPVVRGVGSIGAGGRALVLVDGVPGSLDRLNPNDIKSVSVVKDASAAAIYGARGAFGVILVTTKDGEKGKVNIDYSFNAITNKRTVVPEFLTDGYLWAKEFDTAYFGRYKTHPTTVNDGMVFSQEYLQELQRRHENGTLPSVGINPATGEYVYYGSTDWDRLLYNDYDPAQEHNLSISGGNDKSSFYISGRYYHKNGIYRYNPDAYNDYNLRAKGSLKVFPWLEVTNNFSLSSSNYNSPESHHVGGNPQRRIYFEGFPIAMLRNPDGTFTKTGALTIQSFFTGDENASRYFYQNFKDIVGLNATFLDNRLNIHGDFSYIYTPYNTKQQRTPISYSESPGEFTVHQPDNEFISRLLRKDNYIGTNLYASFEQKINKHNFKLLAGFNYENTDREDVNFTRYELLNPSLPDPSLAIGQNFSLSGGGYEWTTAGVFSRINYNYDDRYLVELNGRYDGSSKFPFSQQFGFFPSVSAGWRVSQESFWKVPKNIVSDLKIRGSYGSLGNGNVAPYSYLETMPVSKLDLLLGGINPQMTNNPNVIPEGLTWEKVRSFNGGIDVSLLDYRLDLTFDKYVRYTDGMFTPGLPLPGVLGASAPKGNYADLRTPGWELSLGWRDNIDMKSPFNYSVKFTLSDNYSEVTKYNNPNGLIDTYYKGQIVGDVWGYQTDGLFQSVEQIVNEAVDQSRVAATTNAKDEILPGDVKFVDRNDDGKIDRGANTLDDHGDLFIVGNVQPRYLFGFTGSANWHNFDFRIFVQGVGKRGWWPGNDAGLFWGQFQRPYDPQPMDVYNNYWREDRRDAYFPRLVGYEANGTGRNNALNQPSDRYFQNAAYIRLKNISVGYNLPASLTQKVGLSSVHVYFSGDDLWVYSPLFKHTHAIDPEAIVSDLSGEKNAYVQDIDVQYPGLTYPTLKSFTFGIRASF